MIPLITLQYPFPLPPSLLLKSNLILSLKAGHSPEQGHRPSNSALTKIPQPLALLLPHSTITPCSVEADGQHLVVFLHTING